MDMLSYFKKIEKTLGGLKFAVVIILCFALYLIIGTFQESYHGAEYANRLIYKSLPFMFLQLLMFLSILFATTLRLPLKKHLYGFYVLHLGLLTIFVGSFVTYKAGVDGNLTLMPNTPTREIEMSNFEFNIYFEDENKKYTLPLPYNSSETKIDKQLRNINVKKFLPFASEETEWVENKTEVNSISTQYKLYNDRFAEKFFLSMHPDSDYETTLKLGLLSLHYMPPNMAPCFASSPKSEMIIWDAKNEICETPEQLGATLQTASTKNKFLVIKKDNEFVSFFPDLSPLPIDKDKKVIENSPYRIFSLKLFKEKPHLFLFGSSLAYYDSNDEKWSYTIIDKDIELPWMGFKINTLKHSQTHYPKIIPKYITPIQDGGKIIAGNNKAVLLTINNTDIWVTDNKPIKIMEKDKSIVFSLENTKVKLPYEIVLDKFKMDTDPGTNNPASYESFVSLFDGKKTQNHHVFMNNPMKYNNFTFYQASYFPVQNTYGSVFSVNYDPGRPIKYFGSLLLILGSIWHFVFRNRKRKKNV